MSKMLENSPITPENLGIKDARKAKEYITCILPQAAYRNFRSVVHVTDRAGVGPIGRRLSLRPQGDL